MSNFDVNRLGKAIAERAFRKQGYTVNEGKISFDNGLKTVDELPLVIWTKMHQTRQINNHAHDVTGKDEMNLERLKKDAGGDVVLCWVDAGLGLIKFGTLSDLMEPKVFEEQTFPHIEVTHHGRIVYFNVHLIKTLTVIDEDDLAQLRREIHHNRNPKNQISLF